jgi:hypothetical protein
MLLLATGPLPLWLIAIPVVWAGIGTTAAMLLNVPEDFGLMIAGVLGLALLPFWGHARHASRRANA